MYVKIKARTQKHMHREIPSRLALEIILLLAILTGGYTIIEYQFFINTATAPLVARNSSKADMNADRSCKTRVYQGEAKIRGWYVKSGNDWLLAVAGEDMKNLPKYDGTEEYTIKNKQIKLVDITPAVEKKLKQTSEAKPQLITITGYAARCSEVPLASIRYKDGIFRKYLNL
jgi:hypothetical protein